MQVGADTDQGGAACKVVIGLTVGSQHASGFTCCVGGLEGLGNGGLYIGVAGIATVAQAGSEPLASVKV